MRRQWTIAATLILLAAAGCGGRDCVELPEELLGRWTTPTAPYADRHMAFRYGEVEFGIGGGEATRHDVVCVVRGEPDQLGWNRYDIVYHSSELDEYTLSVRHDPASGILRLQHREGPAWSREERRDAS